GNGSESRKHCRRWNIHCPHGDKGPGTEAGPLLTEALVKVNISFLYGTQTHPSVRELWGWTYRSGEFLEPCDLRTHSSLPHRERSALLRRLRHETTELRRDLRVFAL